MEVPLKKHQRIRVNGPKSIFIVMLDVLMREDQVGQDQEHFWVLGLANNNLILFLELVCLGNMNMVHVDPMAVFRVPLLKGAAKIVMIHNHPGTHHLPHDMNPSEGDNNVTERMIQVGKIIKLPVIEHLIISPTLFFSYKETGYLTKMAERKKWVPRYQEEERIRNEALKIGNQTGLKKGKKIGMEKGLKEGLKEGKKIGMEKGIEKGKKEGSKEGAEKEKLKIAQKMKQKDLPIPFIASTTGLTEEEIEKL
jgi:DNA repair protein RadC